MNSIQIIASLTGGTGIVILGLAIPLILRRVPPNDIYGIRTKGSFASESDWYRINSVGGCHFAVSGFLILVVGTVGFFLPRSMFGPYSIAAAIVTLLAVLVPCVRLGRLKSSKNSHDGSHG